MESFCENSSHGNSDGDNSDSWFYRKSISTSPIEYKRLSRQKSNRNKLYIHITLKMLIIIKEDGFEECDYDDDDD